MTEAANRVSGDRSHRRILVVAADPGIRDQIKRALADSCDLVLLSEAATALAVISEWQPNLILGDAPAPGDSGLDLMAVLRADPRTTSIPLILLTARDPDDTPSDYGAIGADDYLTIPFGARELKARVRVHLNLADLRRAADARVSASEARIQQLVSILPAGIIACDADGRITYSNPRAADICGSEINPPAPYAEFARKCRVLDQDGSPLPPDMQPIALALKTGRKFQNVEFTVRREDDSVVIVLGTINPTFDREGGISGAIAILQDITAHKQARVALRQTEERYRALFQQASVGIMECDLEGVIVRSNPALTGLLGFTAGELVGMNWRQFVPPEDLKANVSLVGHLVQSNSEPVTVERRYLRKDGSTGWLNLFATVIRNDTGQPLYGLGVMVDISERKHAEAELRETEQRFRLVADNAPVLIWMADTEKRCTWFNQPWLQFVGRTVEEESGIGWADNIHPDDYQPCLGNYMNAFDRRESFDTEFRLRRHDGEYRWMLVRGVPRYQGTDFAGYIGSCIDISDRRGAEEAMQQSRNAERARRQELEVLTQVAPAGIWMSADASCERITGNAAAHAMMRVRAGQDLSRTAIEPDDPRRVTFYQNGKLVPLADMPMRVAARTGRAVANQEMEFRFSDGSSTWAYGSATPLLDEKGAVRGVICIMVDITERRRAETALRRSEEQLRLVTDHASVLLAQVDREHRYRFVNRSYAERYGRVPSDVVGLHVSAVMGTEAYGLARGHMERALAGTRAEFEVEIAFTSVGKRWGHVVYIPERTTDGKVGGFVAVIVDITQRKRAEMELERARDEAIAASRAKDDFLAALSHELRTPLSPVLLIASEAAGDVDLPLAVRADFETIRKSVELEARLIDDLLDLTRIVRNKLTLEQREVNLNAVISDALRTVQGEFNAKHLKLSADVAPEQMVVWGDAVRLQQVFWNILKNAAKFTPDGGRVTVVSRLSADGSGVVVEISDTGIGITQQEMGRVFEAFSQGDHATPSGSHRFGGLGLGLAISQRVMQLHHGRITAESKGRHLGALFRVEMPVHRVAKISGAPAPASAPAAPAQPTETPAANPPSTQGGTRILLVEDHASTRVALEQLLMRRRYAVRSAGSVAEARMLAQQFIFDFLVSDIGLPDGNGYDLMKELKDRHGMTGIALTGYGMEEDVNRSQAAGFVHHLTKPVRIQSLDEALARLSSAIAPPVP